MNDSISFDDALESTDYGLIICGVTGNLKGIWVPEDNDDKEIPDSIVEICVRFFGIDPNTDEDNVRLH
jgi:hypothetical protein